MIRTLLSALLLITVAAPSLAQSSTDIGRYSITITEDGRTILLDTALANSWVLEDIHDPETGEHAFELWSPIRKADTAEEEKNMLPPLDE